VLIFHAILAATSVTALLLGPRSARSAPVVAAAALDVAAGASAAPALEVVVPLVAFLGAALTLAAQVERSGLAERAALALATRARGNAFALYAASCALCALLTAVVSLDGAVVLMVPLLLALARRCEAPLAPLFLGVVAVANMASIAVPQGNPTNLVVIDRLGLSPAAFIAHMLLPGLAAAAACAGAVALTARRTLLRGYRRPQRAGRVPLSGAERHAAFALAAAAVAGWSAPFVGVEPWWPFAGAVALALVVRRERVRPIVPWRIAAQVGGLAVVIGSLGLGVPTPPAPGLLGMLAVAVIVGTASALANNLPVSISVTALLAAGRSAYAASIGLAMGSLATPQGSVATLIASELAGASAPPLRASRLAPLSAASIALATVFLWVTL
jgi:arsenical pump membrane protein